MLFDIISNSKLEPADIERERAVILEELKMYQDQPQDYVQNIFEELMWPGHPLGRDIAGTEESVTRLTRDDILEYADAHYRLPNLVVGLGGSESTRPAMVDASARRLTLAGGNRRSPGDRAPARLEGPRVMVRRRETEQAHICLGTRAFSYLHPDRYAFDLLNTVLGEGMSSRLFLNIRERLGTRLRRAQLHAEAPRHGLLGASTWASTRRRPWRRWTPRWPSCAELCDEDVLPEELTRAKEFTKGRLRLGARDHQRRRLLAHLPAAAAAGRSRASRRSSQRSTRSPRRTSSAWPAKSLSGPIQMAVIGPFASDSAFRQAISG